jgi:hypothetical protein
MILYLSAVSGIVEIDVRAGVAKPLRKRSSPDGDN